MDYTTSQSLSRLLSRLEHTLLSPASESRLRNSAYERKRVSANLDHARTLFLSLEKHSATIRVQSQKQQGQIELSQQRDVLKRLGARIQELEEQGKDDSDSEADEDDAGSTSESVAAPSYGPAILTANSGIDIGETPGGREVLQRAATAVTNELRSRKPQPNAPAATTTTAREELFAGRKQEDDSMTSEAILAHHMKEQQSMQEGLLGLAQQLKQSSLRFAETLENEKDIQKRAEDGLDKNAQGMEAAERKMGTLRRMTEGKGWWARLKLYGFIAGLWLTCFLVVFVGPKIRF